MSDRGKLGWERKRCRRDEYEYRLCLTLTVALHRKGEISVCGKLKVAAASTCRALAGGVLRERLILHLYCLKPCWECSFLPRCLWAPASQLSGAFSMMIDLSAPLNICILAIAFSGDFSINNAQIYFIIYIITLCALFCKTQAPNEQAQKDKQE